MFQYAYRFKRTDIRYLRGGAPLGEQLHSHIELVAEPWTLHPRGTHGKFWAVGSKGSWLPWSVRLRTEISVPSPHGVRLFGWRPTPAKLTEGSTVLSGEAGVPSIDGAGTECYRTKRIRHRRLVLRFV